ncbi:MAG: TRAP transporter large permease subunit [Alphaproteobacteria bacterium]|nr:TRAP transporter large permease subunit [Alphaproteobacteria bacterium]
MDVGTITVLMIVALMLLMLTGMPLGITTLVVSIGITLFKFGEPGLFLVASNVLDVLYKYPLVAVPLFVLMASILERSGVAEDLFNAMAVISGNIRGGVAVQTTLVAVIMAAMTGVVGGEIVMLGLIALPQMLRLGYDRKLAMGTICASGILATLIPPSIVMIVYGFSAGISITDLFLAGITPGVMYASMFILYILLRCNLQPHLAPLPPDELQDLSLAENAALMKGLILPLLLVGWVMGAIYGGIASVTEAAAVGVFGAILTAAVRRHLSWTMILDAIERTMYTMGRIMWLILGAVSLVGIYNNTGGAHFMKSLLFGLDLPPLGIIVVMMLILMLLGTFMEWIAIVFITVPIFAPVVVDLGFDPVWFGILFVMNMQIYFLSPPFGPAAFWLKSVAPEDVTLQEIFAGVLPFIGLQVTGMFLVLFFPEIAMWLPAWVNSGG